MGFLFQNKSDLITPLSKPLRGPHHARSKQSLTKPRPACTTSPGTLAPPHSCPLLTGGQARWPPGFFWSSEGILLPQALCTCYSPWLDPFTAYFCTAHLLMIFMPEYHFPRKDFSISLFMTSPPTPPGAPYPILGFVCLSLLLRKFHES